MSATENTPLPKAQPPVKFTGLKLSAPKKYAAGVPALISTAKHIIEETEPGRGFKTLMRLNQKKGVDCPGCAWPDPDDHRSALGEYCENGAKAIAEELDKKRADAQFFKQNSVYELSLLSDYEIGKKGRLEEPMVLYKGEQYYTPISWDNAFELIGKELNKLNHPDEAVFYTSGRTSNEAAFLYQLFVRQFGTNNLPDCSNMCHESSGVALGETTGIGKGSVKLEDFYETELIIILGQNPGTNHPRMMSALQKAKKNGATIISVNPLQEAGLISFINPQHPLEMLGSGTTLSDEYLQVKINGDLPLFKALIKLLYEKEQTNPGSVFDLDFINNKTKGYQDLIESIKEYDLEELAVGSGISLSEIRKVAEIIASKKKIIACWAMGLTQHKNSVKTIAEIVNLLLLKGSIAKPGAGTCPVRGHSNVQGDRTMGIYEKPSDSFLNNLEKVFHFKAPRKHGYDTVDAIKAMERGKAHVFIGMGGNFLSATPDTEYTAKALRNCRLTVHVSTKPNRSHFVHGEVALILPCLARTDKDIQASGPQFVTVENSMGVVHSSEGTLEPKSNKLKSECAIVAGMAKATLKSETTVNWDELVSNYDNIRDVIEKTIPGFDNYNQRARIPEGFYLPNCAREGTFSSIGGAALLTVNDWEEIKLESNQFILMTIRTHDQFNTTIYGLHDRYRGIYNERRVLMMNKNDMQKHGLNERDNVNIISHFNGEKRVAERFLVIPYNIPEQCLATYFPEANVLVPIDSYADRSQTPTSKSVIVTVERL
ncbi:MAG: FdhF/YdeP family oxidoreductase [Bacteroidia bacterium]|nr:FdhF/YdeP family oxidoreductase [Bacteroidia bacterium]MCZ2247944.1 FdhF/YdeP family oxidoreductase [Bacteroidia bacterium]